MDDAKTALGGRIGARRPRWGLVAWGLALALAACSAPAEPSESPIASSEEVVVVEAAPSPSPALATQSGPPTGLEPPAPEEQRLVGTVLEHLPAGGYHYLRVAPEQGAPRWVVTLGGSFDEGSRVVVDNFGSRHDFYSRRLDRRFDELLFGVVDVAG